MLFYLLKADTLTAPAMIHQITGNTPPGSCKLLSTIFNVPLLVVSRCQPVWSSAAAVDSLKTSTAFYKQAIPKTLDSLLVFFFNLH